MPISRASNNVKRGLSVDELDILLEINQIVNSKLNLDETLHTVHTYLPRLIQHNRSAILFYNEKSGKLTLHSGMGITDRLSKFLTGDLNSNYLFKKLLDTRKSWRASDIMPPASIKRSPFYHSVLKPEDVFHSIGAPILLEGDFVGIIYAARPESQHDFAEKDLRMLEMVTNLVSIAFSNALAYRKDLKEKEYIINTMEQKVKQAERLAALGRAAAIIAHEIKNPLTSIRLSLYTIEKKASWKMDYHEDLTIVKEALDRVSRTMEDLLHFSGDTKLWFKEVCLNELLQDMLAEFKSQANNNVIIETNLDKHIPLILGDNDRLKEILRNLLANAIAATDEGGTVRISTDTLHDRVAITVEDSGSGISPAIQDRIFEPFFTTKQSGTGLGLAIAKKNVEAHKGTIEVHSEPKWGTKFTITLPAYYRKQEGVPW